MNHRTRIHSREDKTAIGKVQRTKTESEAEIDRNSWFWLFLSPFRWLSDIFEKIKKFKMANTRWWLFDIVGDHQGLFCPLFHFAIYFSCVYRFLLVYNALGKISTLSAIEINMWAIIFSWLKSENKLFKWWLTSYASFIPPLSAMFSFKVCWPSICKTIRQDKAVLCLLAFKSVDGILMYDYS